MPTKPSDAQSVKVTLHRTEAFLSLNSTVSRCCSLPLVNLLTEPMIAIDTIQQPCQYQPAGTRLSAYRKPNPFCRVFTSGTLVDAFRCIPGAWVPMFRFRLPNRSKQLRLPNEIIRRRRTVHRLQAERSCPASRPHTKQLYVATRSSASNVVTQ